MRATLNIPDKLIAAAQEATGQKSKTRAITIALEEFVRQKKARRLLTLKGKVAIDYDWKQEEEKELQSQLTRETFHERKR